MVHNETRIEHDSLGEIHVPRDALYGAQTMRAIQNYPISGRTADPHLVRAYLRLKRAAAAANHSTGVIQKLEAELIFQAVDRILSLPESDWPRIFPVDPYQAGAGTSQNMNLNEVIANQANLIHGGSLGNYSPIHPNDHVNRSQSTNDSFPTAMRLAILDASRGLISELKVMAEAFQKHSGNWMELPKSARTHLQDAVPITLGQEFGAYALTFKKMAKWLEASREELRELGIGGSAAGTGLTVPKGYPEKIRAELERLTAEPLRIGSNLCELMQSQSAITHYSSSLRLIALECARICNDLRLLASGPLTGLSEIFLPAVQPGSSIMPGKVNPSILEMANQAWYSVLGYDQSVAYSTQAGQLELNVMMPIMAYSMLEATKVTKNTLQVLRTRCVEGLEPNIPRLKKYFESTPQIATALSPKLGYDRTAELVKEALKTGKSVIELVKEKNLIPAAELEQLIDTQTLTGRK